MSIDTILTAVGDVAAAVAIGAALWTVRLTYRGLAVARQTVDLTVAAGEDARALLAEAGRARAAAEEARQGAEAQREVARLERLRERGERVGELVEEVFWAAQPDERYSPPTPAALGAWMPARNRLRAALVGLTGDLPESNKVSWASSADEARAAASRARTEVEIWLSSVESRISEAGR